MGILDEIEKILTEQGSSSILQDNVAFLRDQIVAFITENGDLTEKLAVAMTRISILETDNKDLQAKNEEQKAKIRYLETVIRNCHEDHAKVCEQRKRPFLSDSFSR